MFTSLHYVGKDMNTTYTSMEPWKKVYGPIFVYLNSASSHNLLWTDAKRQVYFNSVPIIVITVYA